MFKKAKYILCAGALLFSMCACGAGSDTEPLPTLTPEVTGEHLTGRYVYSDGMSEISCEFRDNNTVRYSVSVNKEVQSVEGAYVFDGKTLTIKNADGDVITCEYDSENDAFDLEGVTLTKASAPQTGQ